MTDDPGRTAADLARWAEQMRQKSERFQSLQVRMTQLAVTTTSSDQSITVAIDANGVPTDIRFTDAIRRKSPAALSAELMQCLGHARETLVRDITATVREVVGDDPIGANIIKQYEDRYAAPDAPVPASPAPSTAPDPVRSQQSAPPQAPAPRPPAPPEASAPSRPAAPPEPLPTPSSLVPDVDDEEGEYYRRASWLV
ncbi:YbaB/EbfC family nucleoid-associated protein [Nocardia sp. X0981]